MFKIARVPGISKRSFLDRQRVDKSRQLMQCYPRGPHEESDRPSTVLYLFCLAAFGSCGLADTDPPVNSQSSFQPLSPQEKFDYYVQHTFAMGDVLETSALAGIAQWRGSPL